MTSGQATEEDIRGLALVQAAGPVSTDDSGGAPDGGRKDAARLGLARKSRDGKTGFGIGEAREGRRRSTQRDEIDLR